MLYYIPFEGVIQTPSSVWWVDKEILVSLYILFIMFLLAVWAVVIVRRARDSDSEILPKYSNLIYAGATICFLISGFIYVYVGFFINGFPTNQIILLPLLVLKMFCTGKYSGLLVSFGLVYIIVVRYRKIEPGLNRSFIKFSKAIGLIIIGLGIFIFVKLPGDWEERLLHQFQTAKSELAFEDLLDAVKTIADDQDRIEIFKRIAVEPGTAGNRKLNKPVLRGFIEALTTSGKSDYIKLTYLNEILEVVVFAKQKEINADDEIFQGIINLARTVKKTDRKTDAIRKIILTIVKTRKVETAKGLSQQAIDVIQTMHPRVRNEVFKKISVGVADTADEKWAKVIFIQLIHAIETVADNGWFKVYLLVEVLEAVASREDMDKEKEIFIAAVNAANTITFWRNKSLALKATAIAIQYTGDIKWAESVARQIPDTEIRDDTLKEILR